MRMSHKDRIGVRRRIRLLLSRTKFKWNPNDETHVKLFRVIERLYWERINRDEIIRWRLERYRAEVRSRFDLTEPAAAQAQFSNMQALLDKFAKRCDVLTATLIAHKIPLPPGDER
jgi:hypothetical protein